MAAYAALVSLNNLMETIKNHPRPPITFEEEQSQSLCEKVGFLQGFLETYPRSACDVAVQRNLEDQITEAASAIEYIIESRVADQILSTNGRYQDFGTAIEEMELIKQQVIKIQETSGVVQGLKPENSIPSTSTPKITANRNLTMVGFDEALIEIMEQLTTQQPALQILPITGMGGIGKTTLARNVYDNLCIVQHFHVRIWVTISQNYRVRDILLEALRIIGITDVDKKLVKSGDKLSQASELGSSQTSGEKLSLASEAELGVLLHKSLSERRYLIVMDDMWSTEAWDCMKLFFPHNDNGSRILITTRLSDMAGYFDCSAFRMNFLDKDKSWDLLRRNVFAQECCPEELEETGKKIAINCRGLPLSIVLVGGILANSERTPEKWEDVAKNLCLILNLEDDEQCLNILSLSYNNLSVHLKPCFLYVGVFPEDEKIRVSVLIKLWVSEGFVKPIEGKSLELAARSYLNDLIDRNLILVNELGCSGKVKFCQMHDLVRGLCLRECDKEKFIDSKGMVNFDIFHCIQDKSRVSIHRSTLSERDSMNKVLRDMPSASCIRSLLCDFNVVLPFSKLGLLRVFDSTDQSLNNYNDGYSPCDMPHLVNSRYLSFRVDWKSSVYPSSFCQLWNLQTIVVKGTWIRPFVLPHEIWEMLQLRHLHIDRHFLPSPSDTPTQGEDPSVLINLQRLSVTINFRFSEHVINRIPNINKLHVTYDDLYDGWSYNWCLNNIHCLKKLESLVCIFPSLYNEYHQIKLLQELTFPLSLKKLSLSFSRLSWDDMSKIGSLPHLEVLKLEWEAFCGPEWIPVEGEFLCLKFLLIQYCKDLVHWEAEKTQFPRLEHLVLEGLYKLKDIPLDIGEIPTLRLMEVIYCSSSAVISAKNILDEQETLGNEGLRVRVRLSTENEHNISAVGSLASKNFEVQDRFAGRWVGQVYEDGG